MKPLLERLQSLEAHLGAEVPAGYRSFLSQPFSQPEELLIFPCEGYQFTVQSLLRLDDGADSTQLDFVFECIRHALPRGMIPFAADIGGGFYCLPVTGEKIGCVVWWDHERQVGDDHVEDVAASFEDFMSSLTVFTDDYA